MPRFEVVNAPLEERVSASIASQAKAAARSACRLFEAFRSHRQNTITSAHALFANEVRLQNILATAATLLLPSQLPGCLLSLALVFFVARLLLVRVLARRSIKKLGLKRC